MLYRLYGKEKIADLISEPSKGETMVHKAARSGLYTLVADEMIGELGFNIDFWEQNSRLTVVNQIIKYRRYFWDDEEKSQIRRLIRMSEDLLLKNCFNSTIAKIANICQKDFPENYKFIMEEFEMHMQQRILVKAVCLDKHRQETYPQHVTRNIFKEIQKYLAD